MVLDEAAVHRIREARKGLLAKVAAGCQVYGVTTRTGPEKGRLIGEGQAFQLEVGAGYGDLPIKNALKYNKGRKKSLMVI